MSGNADSASAIHSGSTATISAERPEGTNCSATKVPYWPPTSSSTPTMATIRR